MPSIMNNRQFVENFEKLSFTRLNPRRHTAATALDHSKAVATRVVSLGTANDCTEEEILLLENLGRSHDIGKVSGSANPERSLEVLRACGVDDPVLIALVKWHDISLPWYQASMKGQSPSEKAWRRLSVAVDMPLLAMFMVADRVDAPAGWRRNAPTLWFLSEALKRGMISDLCLDLPEHPSEVSAGGALVREHESGREVLLIRVRSEGYELPKGGIEWDELPSEAAERETREETNIETAMHAGSEIGHIDYFVQ